MRPALVAVAFPLAIGTGALALLSVGLHRATASDRFAVGVLDRLDGSSGVGASVDVAGRSLDVACAPTGGRRSAISLGNGTQLVIAGTHVVRTRVGAARVVLGTEPPDLMAAEADLAGSHDLYERELAGTIFAGPVILRPLRFDSRAAYAVRLGDGRPLVELIVDARTLRPLGARYQSESVAGTSRLLTAPKLVGC